MDLLCSFEKKKPEFPKTHFNFVFRPLLVPLWPIVRGSQFFLGHPVDRLISKKGLTFDEEVSSFKLKLKYKLISKLFCVQQLGQWESNSESSSSHLLSSCSDLGNCGYNKSFYLRVKL